MPRYVAYRNEDAILAFNGKDGRFQHRFPDGFAPEGGLPPGAIPLHRFDAPDIDHAWRYYNTRLKVEGCPVNLHAVGGDGSGGDKLWRYRGDVGHLIRLGASFGLPEHVARGIQADRRFRAVTERLNNLAALYFRCHKEGAVAVLEKWDRQSAVRWLQLCEQAVLEAGLLAAAMAEAVDGARSAFGFPRDRCYRVAVGEAPDPGPSPVETSPVGPSPPPDPGPTPPPPPPDPEPPATHPKRTHKAAHAGAK